MYSVVLHCTICILPIFIWVTHECTAHSIIPFFSLNLITFNLLLQHRCERSQRDHRRECVQRFIQHCHDHHLCDRSSATVPGNQSQSQHRRQRRRQDGETRMSFNVGPCAWSSPSFFFLTRFASFSRTMQISFTLTCGRRGSHGVVSPLLRRAPLPSSLKDRPSSWTSAPQC